MVHDPTLLSELCGKSLRLFGRVEEGGIRIGERHWSIENCITLTIARDAKRGGRHGGRCGATAMPASVAVAAIALPFSQGTMFIFGSRDGLLRLQQHVGVLCAAAAIGDRVFAPRAVESSGTWQKDVSSTEMVVMDSPHGQSSGPALRSPLQFLGDCYNLGDCSSQQYLQIYVIYADTLYLCFLFLHHIFIQIHYIALYFTYIKSWITMACPKLSIGVYTENWLRSNCIRMPRFSRHSLSKKFEENTGKFYAKSSPATDNQKHP